MLSKLLVPDYVFDNIYKITPEFLLRIGIRALVCDIDNTLVTYDDPEPTEPVRAWFDAMSSAGISVSFVSNNGRERVEKFNSSLKYFASWKSGKPGGREIIRAMEHMKSSARDTAMVGDQLLTDAAAGKRLGLTTIIVPPIKDKTTPFFRFKRLLEVPYMKKYYKNTEKDGRMK